MKPVRVSGENFRSWEAFDVAFEDGCMAIVGPNGVGKSSLLVAIETALFGAPGGRLEALVRRGEPEMSVTLDFEHGGEAYTVTRGWRAPSGGKSYCSLHRGVEALTAESIKATDQRILDVIGIDRAAWRASAYLAQGDGDAFTNAGAAERKAILGRVLGLGLWGRLGAQAKADRSRVQASADQLGLRVGQLREVTARRAEREQSFVACGELVRAAEARVAGLEAVVEREAEGRVAAAAARARHGELTEAHIKAAEALHEARSAVDVPRRALQEIDEAVANLDKLREWAADRGALRMELEDEQKRAEAARTREVERRAWEAKLADAHREAQAAQAAIAKAERAATAAAAHLDAFDAQRVPECPTCGQSVGQIARARARAAMVSRVGDAKHELEVASAAAETLRQRVRLIDAEKPGVVAYDAARVAILERRVLDAERAADMVGRAEARLEGRPAVLEAYAAAEARVAAALAAERAALEAYSAWQAPAEVPDSRPRLTEAREELHRGQVLLGAAQRDRELLDEADEKLARYTAELGEAAREAALFGLLEKAYGRDGVPSMLIESAAVPQMERDATRVAVELGGDYRIELRSRRALKGGGESDTLDCVAVTASGEAPIETLSGGERTRFDLALRIALARLLADRRGADVRMLAIDEPEGLDVAGMERLAGLMRGMTADFDSVLLISHNDYLRDALDVTLAIERDHEGRSVLA